MLAPMLRAMTLFTLLTLPQAVIAGTITYDIQNYPTDQNAWTLSGAITTDGKTGVLAPSDILSWTWTITGGPLDEVRGPIPPIIVNSTDEEAVQEFPFEIHKSLPSNGLRISSLIKVVSLLARTYGKKRRILGQPPSLRNYIVATGSNGSQSLVSLGEINPSFGNPPPGSSDLIAYKQNGSLLSSPQLIVPQDTSGARNVTNLAGLNVLSVPQAPTGPGGYSSEFAVSVPGNAPVSVNLATLKSFPSVTETVTYTSGSSSVTDTFTGVPLWNLLSQLGATQNSILTKYLTATGSDGYKVLFSLAEFDPKLGAPTYPMEAIVAYADSNGPLIDSGFARLVIPGDNAGGRFVSNLVDLEVVDAVPEPTSALLLISGLAAIALLTWSQNRSSSAGCIRGH